jgi:hypothetical protein
MPKIAAWCQQHMRKIALIALIPLFISIQAQAQNPYAEAEAHATAVLNAHLADLMKIKGVSGAALSLGERTGEVDIALSVKDGALVDQVRAEAPDSIDGVPILVEPEIHGNFL